jgi:hypothetical protein
MSQIDVSFLRGIKKDELSKLIADQDPRIAEIKNDPELKKKFLQSVVDLEKGELTKPWAEGEKPAEAAPPEKPPVEEPPKEPPKEAPPGPPKETPPAEGDPLLKEAEKRGFKSIEALLKSYDHKEGYIKNLEPLRDQENARRGAEGGPLGQKVKELEATILELKTKQAEKPAPAPASAPPPMEIPDVSFDRVNPEDYSDPELAKLYNKQQDQFSRALKSVNKRVATGPIAQPEQDKLLKKLEEKFDKVNATLLQMDEKIKQGEADTQQTKVQESFNKVYAEGEKFIAETLKLKPTRSFKEIDQAIAKARQTGMGDQYLNTLPDIDKEAYQRTIKYVNSYGFVDSAGMFVKYPSVDSLDDLYKLDLLKSGKLDELKEKELTEAGKEGARKVIEANEKAEAGAKGIPNNKLKGEVPDEEPDFAKKKQRLTELMSMGGALWKNPKLLEEYNTLRGEVMKALKTVKT